MRLLFCLPTTGLSGGVKVVFELGSRLSDDGHQVDIFSFAGAPTWCGLRARLLDTRELTAVEFDAYDFVVVANAFFVPLVLPHVHRARVILLCQDYESFHHASGGHGTYADFMAPSPAFDDIYRLDIPLVATSRPIADLLKQHTGRSAYTLPIAVDQTLFRPMPRKMAGSRKRILLVGNYLMPYKGMSDGLAALRILAEEMPVQLVIATQERRSRAFFDDLPFPVELHFCPGDAAMPDIMASCDVYCCTSWYEGLGLPALECFCCGVPVVSTRTYGVMDYGVDEENLLLARPNDPDDLCRQLRRVLQDTVLADKLRHGGSMTVKGAYDWPTSVARFKEILTDIEQSYAGAGVVSPAAMGELLARLERTGALTPIDVFRRYQDLAADLDVVIGQLLAEGPSVKALETVGNLRDEFRRYLEHDRTQYYSAFRAKYDFCGLLLSLRASDRFIEYLSRVLEQSHERAAHTPSTLSEIRYPVV